MKERRLATNCPNCGGVLTKEGHCEYCNTHVRLANEIDLDANNWLSSNNITIMLNIKRDNEIILMPIEGRIMSVEQHISFGELPEVRFEFCGHVISPDMR